MFKHHKYILWIVIMAGISCNIPSVTVRGENKTVPQSYGNNVADSTGIATISWREFFKDKNLVSLIDTALKNNQELAITLQEIEIAKNDVLRRRGALLPYVSGGASAGVEKVGTYTSQGAGDASAEITPGRRVPEYLGDFTIGAYAAWEIDIWKKLRNAKQAAINRYLSTIEGRNFVITNLVSEIASSYYELLSLDYQLAIVKQNIGLQKNALDLINIQKQAARSNELAVQKFQAEVYKSESLQFDILQQIRETENRINLLAGRYPQPVTRDTADFFNTKPQSSASGVPSQLLVNRPDIRQAELELAAAKLDVKVARAEFLPSFGISSVIGLQAFNPAYLMKLPESLLLSFAGDIAGPLINRSAIKAEYYSANARQIQAVYNYERTILNSYIEVSNQLSGISNLEKSYDFKSKQVASLMLSVDAANDLFRYARADYLEVLMTQRDALEARLELAETKKMMLTAGVNLYKALGGGWR
jgi:multidrug efflux system outer membrane protein